MNILKPSDKTPNSDKAVKKNPKSNERVKTLKKAHDKNIWKLVEKFTEVFKVKTSEPMNTALMMIKFR